MGTALDSWDSGLHSISSLCPVLGYQTELAPPRGAGCALELSPSPVLSLSAEWEVRTSSFAGRALQSAHVCSATLLSLTACVSLTGIVLQI